MLELQITEQACRLEQKDADIRRLEALLNEAALQHGQQMVKMQQRHNEELQKSASEAKNEVKKLLQSKEAEIARLNKQLLIRQRNETGV